MSPRLLFPVFLPVNIKSKLIWSVFITFLKYSSWRFLVIKKKKEKNKSLPAPDAIIKPDAVPTADILMICNTKRWYHFSRHHPPPPLSSSPHSLSPPWVRTTLCDGARYQLVSSTCRCGSLVAGICLGVKLPISLSSMNFASPPPRRLSCRHAHMYTGCRGTDTLLRPEVDLYGMVWPPCVVGSRVWCT